MTTQTLRLSRTQIATKGAAYTDQFIGRKVTRSGMVGVVESFVNPTNGASGYPIVRFADGRWARADLELQVIA